MGFSGPDAHSEAQPPLTVMKQTALEPTCPVGTAISLLSGRWRSSIVCALLDEHPVPVRFMDLQRRTATKARAVISRKVLHDELQALQHQQLVIRTQGESIKPPLQTWYGLTPWGAALQPVTDALAHWVESPESAPAVDQGKREGEREPKRGMATACSE
jgi:DNA-binding HxlR family transcriptional regulator